MGLITTGIGLMSSENVNYLLQQGVINKDFEIKHKLINNSDFKRHVQLWSLYCLVSEDISKETGIKDPNEIVKIMREGLNLEQKYPRVESIVNRGVPFVFDSYSRTEGKKRSAKNIDLDNF